MDKQELLQIIEDAANQKMTSLILSYKRISELPLEIFQLTNLTKLDLSRNELSELPSEIGQLTNLTYLDLSRNELSELPSEIFQLTNLTKLDLSRNELSELPSEIGQLTNLTKLDLSSNELSELPSEIGHLTKLTILGLNRSQLRQLPSGFANLTKLTNLGLFETKLGEFPPEIGKLTNLTSLNFGGNQLGEFPPEIGKLTNLKELLFHDNQLSKLPPEIGQLTNLTSLTLSINLLSKLPPEIGQLTNLTYLNLGDNLLNALPSEIGQLTNLTYLDFPRNQLSEIPPEIFQLTNLTSLTLSINLLSKLPSEIGQLTNLEHLNLTDNQLRELPSEIGQLTNLEHLNLTDNQLRELPSEIGQLTNLTYLDLSSNELRELPSEIGQLTILKDLRFNGNPLETPPIEIATQGIEAIALYFDQLAREGVTNLYEAKLLIVGEGAAGKTSLAKKIKDPSYQLQSDEARTEGIEIIQWHFPHNHDQDFQVNIWDFGGQEIYHATHQFFLTKRSVYALVIDNRKEHTNLYYWLNVVELLSDNSPLLLIQNEKGDFTVEINLSELRGRFANLKETLPTNLETNRGLENILSHLKHYLDNLPHIKDKIPKTWLKVREILETNEQDYISLTEYVTICNDNGLEGLQEQLQLSQYLHDLGVCLHFQDDFILKQTVILKPTWGTDAVYRVLDNEQVKKNQGRFSQDDLARIWADDEYVAKQPALLQLMVKFKLCYPLPDQKGWYIAPHLLGKNQPTYPWDDTENLILRYIYEFMPKGIISRFIVIMHRYIEQQDYVWHSGIILNKDGTRAEVIESYDKREIKVRIMGRYKRDMMTIITDRLDEIHQTYPRLKFRKLVPCNCSECKYSQNPHFYTYDNLRNRIAKKRYKVECDLSFEMVSVLELIDDIGLKEEQRDVIDDKKINRDKFRSLLADRFSEKELKDLCFALNVKEEFNSETKTDLTRNIVEYFERRGMLNKLHEQASQERPALKEEFSDCLE